MHPAIDDPDDPPWLGGPTESKVPGAATGLAEERGTRPGLVEGLPWTTMLADYDLTAGRIWVLVPIWTLPVPMIVRRAQRSLMLLAS